MRPLELRDRLASGPVRAQLADALATRGLGILAGGPAVTYVRYKPGIDCVLGLEMRTGDGALHRGYLKSFLRDDPAVCLRKYESRSRGDGWAMLVPELAAVYFHFPLDRSLAGLWYLASPDRLKHSLHAHVPSITDDGWRVRARKSRVEVVKYKPERRCIVRADLSLVRDGRADRSRRAVVAQAYADDRGAIVHRAMERVALRAGETEEGELRVPAPLGWDASHRILYQEQVEGHPFGFLLDEPDAPRICGAAARALRAVHALAPGDLPVHHGQDDLAEVARIGTDLVATEPDMAPRWTRIQRALRAARSAANGRPLALLHGDFYDHQILAGPGGSWLIDWDEARAGDPLSDVGNFLAHMHLREVRREVSPALAGQLRAAFEGGYFPDAPPPRALAFHSAACLLRLAHVPFRGLAPDWRAQTERILDRAEALLEGGMR